MKWIYIICGIIFAILIAIYIQLADFTPKSNDLDKFLKKIDELELKIDSINKLKIEKRAVIDSTHVKIITNEKHYQERINTIITQPLSADSQYISDYIGRYIESHKSYFQ